MTARRLTLRTERLSELTTSELESVAGASGLPCESLPSLLPTCGCTGEYLTLRHCV